MDVIIITNLIFSSGTDVMDGTEVIEIPINESEDDTVDFKTEVVENESEQDISGTGTSIMPVNSFNAQGTPSTTQVIFKLILA